MFFRNEFDFCSNFHPCLLIHDNIVFPTTEHLFQALKSKSGDVQRMIANKEYPADAKKAGKKILTREDWKQIKDKVMLYVLRLKFSQIKFRIRLLSTYPTKLVENNRWHDNYWGSCVCNKCKDIPKKDMLGILLNQVRKEIVTLPDHIF